MSRDNHDKEYFKERKSIIEKSILQLQEEIKILSPKPIEKQKTNYEKILCDLKNRLESYVNFDKAKIPDSVIEAFIKKIWVSKDEFRWFLRYDENKEKNLTNEEHIKIASFTISVEEAKKFMYSFSTKKRVYNWKDLNVSVWV